MVKNVEIPKAKKCEYCDDFASFKIKKEGLYTYLCNYCHKNFDKVKQEV